MYEIIWTFQAKEKYLETLRFWINRNQSAIYSQKIIAEVKKVERTIQENLSTSIKKIGTLANSQIGKFIYSQKKHTESHQKFATAIGNKLVLFYFGRCAR